MTNEEVVSLALPNSKQTPARLMAWCEALRAIDAAGVEGDVVECGVYRGASIVCSRLVAPTRTCWLYDTFAGMTAPSPQDGQRANAKFGSKPKWLAASRSQVEETIRGAGPGAFVPDKLKFVEGDVLVTLQDESVEKPAKIAALRIDTDWYASTKACLRALYPKLVAGGVVILDDYNYWPGAKTAADTYFGDGFVDANFLRIDGAAVMMWR